VQQRLLALRVHLQLARDGGPNEDIPDLLGYADTEIRAAVEELRDLVHHVLPATLRELSLASALRSFGDRSPVPVTFLELPQQPLPRPIEEAAYYIVAEALANAQKHANASSIRVRIARRLQEVRIEVADDGAGGAVETSGSGLRGLRERTADLGGTFEIDSPRGGGTALTAVFPVG
jgi:signal transduction histidine kinase